MKRPSITLITSRGDAAAATETDVTDTGLVRVILIDTSRRLMGTSAIVLSPDDAINFATELLASARLAKAREEVNAMVCGAMKS